MTEAPLLIPEGGFAAEDFPQVTVSQVPYTTSTSPRPDPLTTISSDDQLILQLGTVGLVFPNREEWNKLVRMAEALWNSHAVNKQLEENKQQQQEKEKNNGNDAAHKPRANRRNSSHSG